jgi:hypothetical protein
MWLVGGILTVLATAPLIFVLLDYHAPEFFVYIAIAWFLFIVASVYQIYLPGQSVTTSIAKFLDHRREKSERSPAHQQAAPIDKGSKSTDKSFNRVTQRWEDV